MLKIKAFIIGLFLFGMVVPTNSFSLDVLPGYSASSSGGSTACTVVETLTDDAINTAISALTSGGCVELVEGEYVVDTGVTINNSGIMLIGAGFGTILKIPDGTNSGISNVVSNRYPDQSSDYDVTDLILKDFMIDGNSANQTAGTQDGIVLAGMDRVTIDNVYVYSPRSRCFIILDDNSGSNDPSLIRIVNSIFDQVNQNNYGIYVDDSSDVVISNNVIMNADLGIRLDIASYHRGTVTGNIFYDVHGGVSATGGSYADVAILGNVVYASGGGNTFGIHVGGTGIVVVGNSIYNTFARGLYIEGSNVVATGNVIDNCGINAEAVGINGDYNIFSNNVIKDSAGTVGISINSNSDYCVISNNSLSGTKGPLITDNSTAGDNFISYFVTSGIMQEEDIVAKVPVTIEVTEEADLTIADELILIDGDDDSDNDAVDLQDGTVAGQPLKIVAEANVDSNDTITINMGDTTCTNCPAVAFDKVGENVSLLWTGTTWVVTGIQDSL